MACHAEEKKDEAQTVFSKWVRQLFVGSLQEQKEAKRTRQFLCDSELVR